MPLISIPASGGTDERQPRLCVFKWGNKGTQTEYKISQVGLAQAREYSISKNIYNKIHIDKANQSVTTNNWNPQELSYQTQTCNISMFQNI